MPDSFEMDCWIINSLNSYTEHAAFVVSTLYTGAQITKTTEFLFDIEAAGEKGISQVLGLAGFTNLDVVRNPSRGAEPSLRFHVDFQFTACLRKKTFQQSTH
jgi:hypothetical protein